MKALETAFRGLFKAKYLSSRTVGESFSYLITARDLTTSCSMNLPHLALLCYHIVTCYV